MTFDRAHSSLDALANAEPGTRRAEVEAFFDALPAIANADAHARVAFVIDTGRRVYAARDHWSEYLSALESFALDHEWVSGDWERACARRSKVQYLLDLYADYWTNDDRLYALDTEETDNALRQRGEHEGPASAQEVPRAVPASHWWWWYPDRLG
jgi:hypothetical protein